MRYRPIGDKSNRVKRHLLIIKLTSALLAFLFIIPSTLLGTSGIAPAFAAENSSPAESAVSTNQAEITKPDSTVDLAAPDSAATEKSSLKDPKDKTSDAAGSTVSAMSLDGIASRIQDIVNINTNKNIKDNFNLDLSSGTASYQYPISVPQGQANFSPSLSLAYSSNSKDIGSIFGYGWNLNGLSYIERSSRKGTDKIYDSANFEFELNLSGSFAHLLDTHNTGIMAGSYGAETESDFLKINYTADNKWEVIDKLGVKYSFGLTSSSISKDPSIGTHIYRWYLDEITDGNKNKIKFEYFLDAAGNKIYLDKIKYNFTKQDNGAGGFNYLENDKTAIVELVRESDARGIYSYLSGFKIANNYSINKINIKLGTQLIKEYALTQQSTELANIRLLKSVNLKAYSESGSFNEETTNFEYQENSLKWQYQSNWTWPASGGAGNPAGCSMDNLLEKWLDINGDGLMDYVHSCAANSQSCDSMANFAKINNGNGTWMTLTGADFDKWGLPYFSGLNGYNGVYIQDFNGDGFQDIYHYWEFSASDTKSKTGFFLNDKGKGFVYDSSWTASLGSGPMPDSSKFMDINGDGLVDLVTKEGSSGNGCTAISTYGIKLNKGNGQWEDITDPVKNSSTPTLGGYGVREVFISDFNGDGLADIYHNTTWGTGCSEETRPGVFINQGNNTFKWDSAWSSTPMIRTIGDYNNGYLATPYRFLDINADNLPDIVYSESPSAWQSVYLNNGNGAWRSIGKSDPLFSKFSIPPFSDDGACALTPSINYDGSKYTGTAFKSASYSPSSPQGIYLNNNDLNPVGFLLSKASDTRGAVISIKYEDSTHYKDASGNLLNSSLPFPIQTVKEITIDNGLGNLEKTAYEYQNGLYFKDPNNPYRKEFAGFGKVTSADSAGNKTINYFHQAETDANNANNSAMGEYQDHISKKGKPYRTESYDSAGNLYSKSISKWENFDLGNGRNFVKLTQRIDSSYDGSTPLTTGGKDKAETYTYDNTNGNLTGKTQWGEVAGSDNGTFTDTGTDKLDTTISYASPPVGGLNQDIIGLVSQEITLDQNSNKVKESKYYYDNLGLGSADKGNQTKEEKWKSGAEYISSQKAYNTYGLVISDTDPRGKITSYAYDSYNLYPATVTNPLNQSTQYLYDYSAGKPKQTIDPNNFIFQTVYDGFGRVIEEKQPDLTTPATLVAKSAYVYNDVSIPNSIKKTDYLDSAISVDSYSYIDGLGRIIQTRQEAEDVNNFSVKDFVYNNQGLLNKESLPYFSFGAAKTVPSAVEGLYSVYTYDALGRITSTTNVVGTITNAYDDWKVTATDAKGNAKDLYKDAYGNLVQVGERNGADIYTTNYNYDGAGNLTKITDALGNIRNFTYDGLGRRLTAEDLHAPADATFGTWTYTYDASGNLISQTDPIRQLANQTVNYTYDDLNRQLTEDYTGAVGTEKTYSYDTCLNGIGRLCSVTTSDYAETKEYNALGAASKETKTISLVDYITQYAYDRQGNNILLINPDGSQVKNIYNSAGQLEQVQRKESADAGFSNIVTDFDYSPLEKITYQADGSTSLTTSATTNIYDAAKLYRLSSKITTIAGGVHAQDLAYTYDANGNITRIIDNSATNSKKITDYTYDSLNRLLSATATGAVNGQNYSETYSYDAIGNITNKNGQAYTYSSAGYANPHAVTSIGGSGGSSVELLSAPWHLNGNNSSAELYQDIPTDILNGKVSLTVTYNLHGICAIGGDASAIIFDQGDWRFVSLANYGQNCLDGEQTVTIPLSDFPSLDTSASLTGSLHTRFWYGSAFTVDILSAKLNSAGGNGGTNYTYDNNGNLLTDGTLTNTWDYNNRLIQTSLPPSSGALITTTATFSPVTGDGSIYKTNSSWTTAQSATSGTSANYTNTTSYVRAGKNSKTSYLIERAFLPFDTSSLPDNATITSAKLKVYVASKLNNDNDGTDWVTVAQGSEANTTSLIAADYDNAGSITNPTEGIDSTERKDITNVTTGQYLTFNLNNTGKNWISLTGSTKFALREGHDATNSAFVGSSGQYNSLNIRTGEYTSTANDPVLEVTYTLPAPTTVISYAYDASGNRIKKTSTAGITTYVNNSYEISPTGKITKYISGGSDTVATIETQSGVTTSYYTHKDHLGGSSVITDSAGSQTELLDYYPYGGTRLDEKAGSFETSKKYTGKELDAETGLYYYGARYYSAGVGRFVSLDPVYLAVGDNARLKQMTKMELERYLADPQLANSYSYAINNPLKYTDPTGDFIDIALDVGFIGYDLYRMGSAAWNGNWGEVKSESVNLGLDVGGAALPGVTGLGMIRRAGEAAKLAKGVEKAGDVIEASKVINLNGPINITSRGLDHVTNNHTLEGANSVRKSVFNEGENITNLIKQGTQQPMILQSNRNYQRVFDVGRNIGLDRSIGEQTSKMTVITNRFGNLITAHPGLPKFLIK